LARISGTDRVAIVVVHGVADQKPGETARAVADLLIAVPSGQASYTLDGADDLGLRVPALGPSEAAARLWDVAGSNLPVKPQAKAAGTVPERATPVRARPGEPVPVEASVAGPAGGLGKALRQSLTSDLNRPRPAPAPATPAPAAPAPAAPEAAASVAEPAHRAGGAAAGAGDATAPRLSDVDVDFSDFLLAKAVRNRMPAATFETQRLRLRRQGEGREQSVDVYEMYWADLSRLASGISRIVTELFTLIFRLSLLGRDTVAAAVREFAADGTGGRRWPGLGATQALLDWIFSRVLGLLALQLLMLVLIIVPAGFGMLVPKVVETAGVALVFAWPALALAWLAYRFERPWHWLVAALAAAAAVIATWPHLPALAGASHWIVGLSWLVVLSAAYEWLLRICEERFPLSRPMGWLLWLAVLVVVLRAAAHLDRQGVAGLAGEFGLAVFSFGALRGVEVVLLAIVACWGLMSIVLVAWLILGYACGRGHGFKGRATVATGRLGLFASLGFFLALLMAAWAVLVPLLARAVGSMLYVPAFFSSAPGRAVTTAACFLEDRYRNSTEPFALIVLLLLELALYVGIGFLPSLAAEAGVLKGRAERLGRWLTVTYRHLDFVVLALVTLSVLCGVVVTVTLVAGPLRLGARLPSLAPLLTGWSTLVQALSQQYLGPLTLILAAASVTVALSVLGRLLSRYVPWLRAPLDAALDVDNHFREFPRLAIPRARIFARFAALLQQVALQGYDRIVIVSHSQGTVISAEMMRYLTARGRQVGDPGRAARLGRSLAGRVRLLTLGSPLRQLYAGRFPVLYQWMLHPESAHIGPTPAAVGVERWINAYTSGDYIGRWLWSRPPRAGVDPSDAMIDQLDRPDDVYLASESAARLREALRGQTHLDACLGPGAHTHYFEPDQALVAAIVDQLVSE
jgi:hypothetical protein